MRVAISTEQDYVSDHFGRCPSFTIVDLENGRLTKRIKVSNPGHHPGFIPQFLHEKTLRIKQPIVGGEGVHSKRPFYGDHKNGEKEERLAEKFYGVLKRMLPQPMDTKEVVVILLSPGLNKR